MNTWVSAEQPLMGQIFQYLPTKDICQWRRTSKNTELTDAFSNHQWDNFVSRTATVHNCGTCSQKRGHKGLFHCDDCHLNVCVEHVVTCSYCLHDLCFRCFTTRGCCWTRTTQIKEQKRQCLMNDQDRNGHRHSGNHNIIHNRVAWNSCPDDHNHGTKGQHRPRGIETQRESLIPITMWDRLTPMVLRNRVCFL